MSDRRHVLTHALTGALTLSVVVTVIFFLNTGNAHVSRTSRIPVDAEDAGPLTFAFIGTVTFVAIIFFTDTDHGEGPDTEHPGSPRGSHRLFARDAFVGLMSIGPLFGFFLSLAPFLWRTFASAPGPPGTVWGDYTSSPLPFIALFAASLASTNVGLAITGVTVAARSNRLGLTLIFANIALSIGVAALFAWFATSSTVLTTVVVVPLGAVSVAVLLGARRPAVSRIDDEKEAAERAHRRSQAPPPYDALECEESVLLIIANRGPRSQEFLLATATRIVHARTTPSGPTEIIDEAAPNQLLEASTRTDRGHTTTVVRFRGRSAMRLRGTDTEEASVFAHKLTTLARTGSLPD